MKIKELPENCEWRGFKFRAYPTEDQIVEIRDIQDKLRSIWNSLIIDDCSFWGHRFYMICG